MQSKQIHWKDVKVGQEIPSLVRHPTSAQLVMWAGAVDDYNPMHQDKEYAIKAGYPGPIVFGPLQIAFLENMITDWIGEGWLKRITVRHVQPLFPDVDCVCKGKVTDKYVKNDEHCVEVEIQAEDPKGRVCTSGIAIIALPE